MVVGFSRVLICDIPTNYSWVTVAGVVAAYCNSCVIAVTEVLGLESGGVKSKNITTKGTKGHEGLLVGI